MTHRQGMLTGHGVSGKNEASAMTDRHDCSQGMEAVARMRCCKGLAVERYLGSFHRRTATDIDLPAINADQSIAVQLRHDDKLDKEAFFQFVVLYTTTQGERRIRCCFDAWLALHTRLSHCCQHFIAVLLRQRPHM